MRVRFSADAMALYPLLRPLVFRLDAERAHGLSIAALERLPRASRRASIPAGDARRGARFPVAGRAGGGLRQGCARARCDAGAGLRLRRGRHADAARPGGQPAAAAVPARRGSRGDQPHGVQQWRAGRRLRAAGGARAARDRRRQRRRQQGVGGSRRRLCAGRRDDGAGRRLSRDQHLLAQHAGPARACRRPPRSTSCSPR